MDTAGREPQDVEAHFGRVDGPNYDDIMREQGGRSLADAVLWLPSEGGLFPVSDVRLPSIHSYLLSLNL